MLTAGFQFAMNKKNNVFVFLRLFFIRDVLLSFSNLFTAIIHTPSYISSLLDPFKM